MCDIIVSNALSPEVKLTSIVVHSSCVHESLSNSKALFCFSHHLLDAFPSKLWDVMQPS